VHFDPRDFARKIWTALAVVAGIVVVVLSWRVPEPETHQPTRSPLVENASYMRLVPQEQQIPSPPDYGARTS
jgi:hypothetical protein